MQKMDYVQSIAVSLIVVLFFQFNSKRSSAEEAFPPASGLYQIGLYQIGSKDGRPKANAKTYSPSMLLIGLGDSLTHGTMDATNNGINTLNAYLQMTAEALQTEISLTFRQPLFDDFGNRVEPRVIPTNLGVDGADIFSMEGIEYYKRVGASESFLTEGYLCDVRSARRLDDKYDKVLYPINLEAGAPVSQIDAAVWLINEYASPKSSGKAVIVLWAGNNDVSTAALGSGGDNPLFIPVPAEQIADKVSPLLRFLLRVGPRLGVVSFDSYTAETIARNLTEIDDFAAQYERLLDRLESETNNSVSNGRAELLLLTLPYYSSIGDLFDSEDIEFYLQQLSPGYAVPASFARVAPPGQPINDPTQGDRISIFTFGLMYMLMNSGYSTEFVNSVLEIDGIQRDGLVLSHAEQQTIAARVDAFNSIIAQEAVSRGPHVHLVNVGTLLNDTLNGITQVTVSGKLISRKWTRGGAFTLDGVHPGYVGQAYISNYLLGQMNSFFSLQTPFHDLDAISATDPYWDQDGDGWAPGPNYPVTGLAAMLALLVDADDSNPQIRAELPADVWDQMSEAMLKDLLGIPVLRRTAQEHGFLLPD